MESELPCVKPRLRFSSTNLFLSLLGDKINNGLLTVEFCIISVVLRESL